MTVNEQSCKVVQENVNNQLARKAKSKVNELRKCGKCTFENKKLPIINSPFDASLVNTGYNGAGGVIASGSGRDLNWEAGVGNVSGPSSVNPTDWIPAYVFKHGAWVTSPFNNANWITVFDDSDHSGNVDIYFRYRFYLNMNPSQFSLDMDFYADNSVHEIYINGQQQSTNYPSVLPQASSNPYGHLGFTSGKAVHISLAKDWKECENEIIVHVKSGQRKIGFLAQNSAQCYEADIPEIAPDIKITWGDSDCDCLETNDLETMSITVCNHYSNIAFKNFTIGKISVVDENGKAVAKLPDGTDSVELVPTGPHCFGDIAACNNEPNNKVTNCVSREFVLHTKGAKSGKYKLLLEGICFDVCYHYNQKTCFELKLCKD